MIIRNNYLEEYSQEKSVLFLKNKKSYNNRALFLDRDGVLIEDVHRIDCESKVVLSSGVLPFLKAAYKYNFDVIIITNQSSLSRGIITHKKYLSITNRILSKLPEYLYPDFIIASFHLPDNNNKLVNFHWRKPGKGMFDYILNLKNYNLEESIMIGDKLTDLIPAYNSNIGKLFYIQSDLHKDEIIKINEWNKDHYDQIKIIKKLNSKEVFSSLFF